jgi:hypothetical protein
MAAPTSAATTSGTTSGVVVCATGRRNTVAGGPASAGSAVPTWSPATAGVASRPPSSSPARWRSTASKKLAALRRATPATTRWPTPAIAPPMTASAS